MDLFSLVQIGLLAGIVYVIVKAFSGLFGSKVGPRLFCPTCGHEGPARLQTRGHFGIELAAWLFFILPGIIYSIWRVSSRRHVCAKCGATGLIPPDSPIAIATREKLKTH